MSVLDRLGSVLCELAPLNLSSGVVMRKGRPVLVIPSVDYDGLVDTSFHLVRQNGEGSPAILIRMLEVLTAVIGCEKIRARFDVLIRHADLVMGDAERTIETPSDLEDSQIDEQSSQDETSDRVQTFSQMAYKKAILIRDTQRRIHMTEVLQTPILPAHIEDTIKAIARFHSEHSERANRGRGRTTTLRIRRKSKL